PSDRKDTLRKTEPRELVTIRSGRDHDDLLLIVELSDALSVWRVPDHAHGSERDRVYVFRPDVDAQPLRGSRAENVGAIGRPDDACVVPRAERSFGFVQYLSIATVERHDHDPGFSRI